MPKLLIATGNKGKVRELEALLESLDLELVMPKDLGLALEVEETGSTYAENAALKARAFAQASGLVSLADDSGLEVDALGGAPGLYSARYGAPIPPFSEKKGGEKEGGRPTDADRRAYLLHNLRAHPRPWTARFHATIAIAAPDGRVRFAEGVCPGEIIPEERGAGGFGYDPIFMLAGSGKTMAELGMDEKNRLSHRARAVQAAVPILEELLGV